MICENKHEQTFIPGISPVPYAGRVYDEKEMISLVDASLDFWLTTGRYAAQFEKELAAYIGVKYCLLTNSGSSANLLAVSALTSPKLGEKRLRAGDEVITTACGFPTTLNPILQNNLVPVFVDIERETYNIQADLIEDAISEKTKAIMVPHTLGNPADLDAITKIVRKYNLWFIEDNCDALGSDLQEKTYRRHSGIFQHAVFILPTTSRWAKGVQSLPAILSSKRSLLPSATGGGTAGANPVAIIPAKRGLTGNWEIFPRDTITSTSTPISAIT